MSWTQCNDHYPNDKGIIGDAKLQKAFKKCLWIFFFTYNFNMLHARGSSVAGCKAIRDFCNFITVANGAGAMPPISVSIYRRACIPSVILTILATPTANIRIHKNPISASLNICMTNRAGVAYSVFLNHQTNKSTHKNTHAGVNKHNANVHRYLNPFSHTTNTHSHTYTHTHTTTHTPQTNTHTPLAQ